MDLYRPLLTFIELDSTIFIKFIAKHDKIKQKKQKKTFKNHFILVHYFLVQFVKEFGMNIETP